MLLLVLSSFIIDLACNLLLLIALSVYMATTKLIQAKAKINYSHDSFLSWWYCHRPICSCKGNL